MAELSTNHDLKKNYCSKFIKSLLLFTAYFQNTFPLEHLWRAASADNVPLADFFDHLVSMDLKEPRAGKVWILHLIDAASRYSAASLIKTKKQNAAVARIFQIWVS